MIDALAGRLRPLDRARAGRVVAALEAVGTGRSAVPLPVLDERVRAEIRAQLVAVTPRLVGEAEPETPARTAAAARDADGRRRGVFARHRRPLVVAAAATTAVVAGLGATTYVSRDALPGDALYGLKRAAEGVQVSLSGSDVDQGHTLLRDAQTRVEEASALLTRPQSMSLGRLPSASTGAVDDRTVTLVVDALHAADDATARGVRTIAADAVAHGTTTGLALVVAWAPGQEQRIDDVLARVPGGRARDEAQASADRVRAADQRAGALLAQLRADRSCRTTDQDLFGPVPCGSSPVPGGGSGSPGTGTAPPTAGATGGGTSASPGAPPSADATPTAPGTGGTGTSGSSPPTGGTSTGGTSTGGTSTGGTSTATSSGGVPTPPSLPGTPAGTIAPGSSAPATGTGLPTPPPTTPSVPIPPTPSTLPTLPHLGGSVGS